MDTRISFVDNELAHYGVKGMRWGVRNSRPEGVSRSTNRAAKKDAKEFTRAKMYYGEGAGNRRKLIKAKVNQRSKDPSYKKAFDHHVANTDWEKRGKEARSKRGRADAVKGAGKAARGVKNVALGNYRNVGVGILATAAAFKGGQALGIIPANSVIKDRAHSVVSRCITRSERPASMVFAPPLGWQQNDSAIRTSTTNSERLESRSSMLSNTENSEILCGVP